MKHRRAKLYIYIYILSFEWGKPFGVCRAPHSPGLDARLAEVCWKHDCKLELQVRPLQSSRCVVKWLWNMRTPLCSSSSNLEPRIQEDQEGQTWKWSGQKCQCVYSMILTLPGLRSKPLGGNQTLRFFTSMKRLITDTALTAWGFSCI